jgi:hypothetical protein
MSRTGNSSTIVPSWSANAWRPLQTESENKRGTAPASHQHYESLLIQSEFLDLLRTCLRISSAITKHRSQLRYQNEKLRIEEL